MSVNETVIKEDLVDQMRQAGAHFGYSKSRRHPSTGKFVYGIKNKLEIFDLTKTAEALERAKQYLKSLKDEDKTILFVGTKNEAKRLVREAAEGVGEPYVSNRWIGGTLTNWSNIQKRVDKLKDMREKRESGDFSKYTKKEQLMLDREIAKLDETFGGIVTLTKVPDALLIIDPLHEDIAVKEAISMNIPVIALANTDCDLSNIDTPIPGNDANVKSIQFFLSQMTSVYKKR